MTWITAPLAVLLLLQSQEAPDPVQEAETTPIIVEGSSDAAERRAQTGSRVAGDSIYSRDQGIATSTGIAGLTPGSGMSPFAGDNAIRKVITTSCISDNAEVGERASCLLLEARQARAENDLSQAADIYRFLVSSEQFGSAERLAGGTELFELATSTGDAGLREEALLRLLASGALDESQRPGARRTLISMALARGDKSLAIERLAEHAALPLPDAQSLANLAVLMREEGLATTDAGQSPAAIMDRAIAAQTASGEPVPDGWQDFVQADAPVAPGGAEETDADFETVTIILETEMGDITVALETERAPITAGNFLRYVDEGRFDGIVFYRAMHLDWGEQPNGLLQGGAQWAPERILPGIPHEPTTVTGLSHTRGALSMAMGEPGTANGDFSIMLGDQTGLDANPEAEEAVWQNGYAVFGYVTSGMDVVEAIHAAPLDPDKGEGWMKGQMLAQPVTIIDARRAEVQSD